MGSCGKLGVEAQWDQSHGQDVACGRWLVRKKSGWARVWLGPHLACHLDYPVAYRFIMRILFHLIVPIENVECFEFTYHHCFLVF